MSSVQDDRLKGLRPTIGPEWRNLLQRSVVGELEVVNATPLMLGDWDGSHLHQVVMEENDPRGERYRPTLLNAKPLIGKARWLLKRIIIHELGRGQNLKEAERAVRITVCLSSGQGCEKTLRMGLVEFLYGSIKAGYRGERSWRAAYTVQVEPIPFDESRDCDTSLEALSYPHLIHPSVNTQTRYRLITLSKSPSEKTGLLPLRPGTLRARIRIIRRRGIRLKPPNNMTQEKAWEKLDLIAVLSIAASLTLLGVGKATTRGFGRFQIKPHTINAPSTQQLYTHSNQTPMSILGELSRIYDEDLKASDITGLMENMLQQIRDAISSLEEQGSIVGDDRTRLRVMGGKFRYTLTNMEGEFKHSQNCVFDQYNPDVTRCIEERRLNCSDRIKCYTMLHTSASAHVLVPFEAIALLTTKQCFQEELRQRVCQQRNDCTHVRYLLGMPRGRMRSSSGRKPPSRLPSHIILFPVYGERYWEGHVNQHELAGEVEDLSVVRSNIMAFIVPLLEQDLENILRFLRTIREDHGYSNMQSVSNVQSFLETMTDAMLFVLSNIDTHLYNEPH